MLSLILSLINLVHIHLRCFAHAIQHYIAGTAITYAALDNTHVYTDTLTHRASLTAALSHSLISQRRRALPQSIPLLLLLLLLCLSVCLIIIIYYLSLIIFSKLINLLAYKMMKMMTNSHHRITWFDMMSYNCLFYPPKK